ncbi:hypothetical protein FDZ71_04035, partial [bacterium]
TDQGKASFYLYGPKNDYYRLAMAKGGETLCDDDKAVEFTAVEKGTGAVIYKVEFVGFDMAKKAEQDRIGKILEEKIALRDPKALDDFARTYRDSPHAVTAAKKSQALKEELAWESARGADSKDSLQAFLTLFPHSVFRLQAQKRLDELKTSEKVAEMKKKAEEDAKAKAAEEARKKAEDAKAKAEEEKARKALANAYASAKAQDSVEAYEKFLAVYPDSPDAPAARARIEFLREESLWNRGKNDEKIMAEYMRQYPKGRHAEEAAKYLEELKSQTGDTLRVRYSAKQPSLDGNDSDPAWAEARILKIPMQDGNGTIEIKAINNGSDIYMLAKWPDKSKNTSYRPWIRNEKRFKASEEVDDAFSVALYMGKNPSNSCMMNGEEQEMDIWLWRSFWSELSGYAADKKLKISRSPMPESNAFTGRSGGSIHLQNKPDAGKAAWELFVPIASTATQDIIPSYVKAQPSGSAADVKAVGAYRNGAWTVEFSRKMNTGNLDDAQLKAGAKVTASFASYDHSEKENHAYTKLITLDIEGK